MLFIELFSNGSYLHYQLADRTTFVVGREESVPIPITEDELVSRVHCCVETNSEKGHKLVNLNPRNGTIINDRKLGPYSNIEIKEGDTVQLGNSELVFHFDSPSLQKNVDTKELPATEIEETVSVGKITIKKKLDKNNNELIEVVE